MTCRIAFSFLACLLVATHWAEAGKWTEVSLENPSFETGESFPIGWRLLKGNEPRPSHPSVIAWDKEFVRTGARSVYMRKEDAGPLRFRSTDPISVTPGTIYHLQVWLRTTAFGKYATAAIAAQSTAFGPDGKQWSVSKEYNGGSEQNLEWQSLLLEFTPPDWVKGFLISISNSTSARDGTAIEFWFDDVSLQQRAGTGAPSGAQ